MWHLSEAVGPQGKAEPTDLNSCLHWLSCAGRLEPEFLICSSPLRPQETQQGQRNMLTQTITCAVLIFKR